jgi:hypothetical protein
METHSELIDRLGGMREVARKLGHTNHTTVQGWIIRDNIPPEHWSAIIAIDDRPEGEKATLESLTAGVKPRRRTEHASNAEAA